MPTAPITFGQTTRILNAGDFTLREVRYAPRTAIPPHAHDRSVLVYVLGGEMQGTAAGETARYAPHSLRVLPAGGLHSNAYGEGEPRCLLIEPALARINQLGPRQDPLLGFSYFGPRALPSVLAARAYHELLTDDLAAPLAIEGLLLEMLAAIVRLPSASSRKPPSWLQQMQDELRAGFRTRINLAELSRTHGVHPVYAARQFRIHFGCPPSDFVRQLRIEWSRAALSRTRISVSTIARDAGFTDQSHFTREFRKSVGVTPARYRASATN